MLLPIRKFLKRIQNSSEAAKKLWLMIFSSATMLVIIVIWVANFNSSFGSLNQAEPLAVSKAGTEIQNPSPEEKTAGLKEIFSAGFKTIGQALKGKLSARQQFSINASDRNFILENLETPSRISLP